MRDHQEERERERERERGGERLLVSEGGSEGGERWREGRERGREGRERDVAHGFPWSHLATLQRRKGAETKYHQCRMP